MTTADLVITNAHVFTSDENNSRAEAVAVLGKKIVYLGNCEGAKKIFTPATHVIDAQGGSVLPGMIDDHMHPLTTAQMNYFEMQFLPLKSVEGDCDRVRQFMRERPPIRIHTQDLVIRTSTLIKKVRERKFWMPYVPTNRWSFSLQKVTGHG